MGGVVTSLAEDVIENVVLHEAADVGYGVAENTIAEVVTEAETEAAINSVAAEASNIHPTLGTPANLPEGSFIEEQGDQSMFMDLDEKMGPEMDLDDVEEFHTINEPEVDVPTGEEVKLNPEHDVDGLGVQAPEGVPEKNFQAVLARLDAEVKSPEELAYLKGVLKNVDPDFLNAYADNFGDAYDIFNYTLDPAPAIEQLEAFEAISNPVNIGSLTSAVHVQEQGIWQMIAASGANVSSVAREGINASFTAVSDTLNSIGSTLTGQGARDALAAAANAVSTEIKSAKAAAFKIAITGVVVFAGVKALT